MKMVQILRVSAFKGLKNPYSIKHMLELLVWIQYKINIYLDPSKNIKS